MITLHPRQVAVRDRLLRIAVFGVWRLSSRGSLRSIVIPQTLTGNLNLHDPSSVLQQDGKYYLFYTAQGIRTKTSDDQSTGAPVRGCSTALKFLPGHLKTYLPTRATSGHPTSRTSTTSTICITRYRHLAARIRPSAWPQILRSTRPIRITCGPTRGR